MYIRKKKTKAEVLAEGGSKETLPDLGSRFEEINTSTLLLLIHPLL